MRLRFAIRDLLWLMIVIALTSIWFLEHKQLKETAAELSSAHMRMGQMENLVLRNAQNLMRPQLTQQEPEQPLDNMPIMRPPAKYQTIPNLGR